ncbi:(Fe-S)-binding protein [Methanogenium organophilum]|uniref:Fe-S cluster protein n=1 Tax=Methanogenium organophilum TaxID=2199 RepID=A0A9X9S1J5_METOG|nr:(Fe-S)-binding protein [Methanogenium organophilum]WAI00164.1 Fe-S cluster protein [Methanogenium organophilum]
MDWTPPGKDCGACGAKSCADFLAYIEEGKKSYGDCPFYTPCESGNKNTHDAIYSGSDIHGTPYDFILEPLPGEVSARKIIVPFRPDLVEKWDIKEGDIVVGRPMGAGCPVQHVLKVIDASPVTGVITTHVVGPQFSRGREYKDLEAYHISGFEGIAKTVNHEPVFGKRQTFLPGFCMMYLAHTGVVNMILNKSSGMHIRVEDIRL